MIKSIFVALAILYSGLSYANDKAIVLMYHSIGSLKNAMTISAHMFKDQMDYLKENNFNIIGSDELVNSIIKKTPLPEKAIVITFDDGWKNQTKAMEVLKEHNFKATFGLVLIHQEMKHKKTWLEQEDFDKYKDQEFLYVNHSYTHFTKDYLKNSDEDVKKSDKVLMSLFNVRHPYYIYPYGLSNKNLIDSLKKYGYVASFGVNANVVNINKVNLFQIPRYGVFGNTSLSRFKEIVNKLNKD